MSKPSQLKAVEQLDNDARPALRSAIEQHQSAVEQHARIAAAAEHANAAAVSCFSAVEQAETALKESEANTDAHVAARALGEDDGTSIVDAEAEAELARKQNDLETARRTRDALKARVERERAEVEQAKRKVNEAAIDVMKAELPIGEMLVRAERLQAELIAARAALCWLLSSRCIGDGHIKRAEHLLRDHDLPVVLEPQFIDFDGHPSAVVWRNAIERLRTNAEAKLPMI